jgi:hypothetical protein
MKGLMFVGFALCLGLLIVSGAVAGSPPLAIESGGCTSGTTYNPNCDVNRDDVINAIDLQLVATHWGQAGTWTADSWSLTGNAGTTPGTNFLGTTDNTAFEIRVNGKRTLRLEPNATSPNWIAGNSANSVTGGVAGATIGGGGQAGAPNQVTADFGTIGGGLLNTASGSRATVAGGVGNIGSGSHATIGGGLLNTASNDRATVAGGESNEASGIQASIGGGEGNVVTATLATVGGGSSNTASGFAASIGGGTNNVAGTGNFATVGGGIANVASGEDATVGGGISNVASGTRATVPGGHENTAAGDYSFAAGRRAKANHNGSFVWGDSTDAEIHSGNDNQFIVRANGGFWFGAVTTTSPVTPTIGANVFISTSTGAYLSRGGTWTNLSDRAAKVNLAPVGGQEVLARLAEIPITSWNYKTQDPSIRHIGPTAQDFYAAFGVGEDDKHVSTVDADGVALSAIQGLYQIVQEKEAQIAALTTENATQQQEIGTLQEQNANLEARLARLEQAIEVNSASARPGPSGPSAGWLLFGGLSLVGLMLRLRWT